MRWHNRVVLSRTASLSRPWQKAGLKSLSRMGGTTLIGCFINGADLTAGEPNLPRQNGQNECGVHADCSGGNAPQLAWRRVFVRGRIVAIADAIRLRQNSALPGVRA